MLTEIVLATITLCSTFPAWSLAKSQYCLTFDHGYCDLDDADVSVMMMMMMSFTMITMIIMEIMIS